MCHYKVKDFILCVATIILSWLFLYRELIMEENTPVINVVAAEAVTNVEIPGVCSWDMEEDDA